MPSLKSLICFFVVVSYYLISFFHYETWTWAVKAGDSWGYYAYLPAAFIHHDLDSLHHTVAVRKKLGPDTVAETPENPLGIGEALSVGGGKYVIKYTMGIAMMELPFFAAAHAYTKLSDDSPADGFSQPYIFAIHFAAICYAMLGLFLLWKSLRRFFSENISLLTIATLALATHLYYFTVYGGTMAHCFQFFLFSLVIYATVRWFESQRLVHALLIGFACGMVTLVRPTEAIILVVPFLFGLKNKEDFTYRLALLRSKLGHVALAALAFCLAGLPQICYWKWTTGHFLHYSYGEEGFDFAQPHIWEGLLGYKNGWLAYTPVMWLGVLGLFLLWRHARDWFWPVLTFMPIQVYLVYSWWCWNYINGFGSRPMVEAAAIMAFPLASFFVAASRRKWATALTAVAVVFCTWLNGFNTWQFSQGLMWSQEANGAFFWRMLGKTEMSSLDLVVFESGEPQPDPESIELVRVLHADDFEQMADSVGVGKLAYSGSRSLLFHDGKDDGQQHGLNFLAWWRSELGPLQLKTGDWVRLGLQAYPTGKPIALYEGNFMECRFLRGQNSRKSRKIRIETKVDNKSNGLWGGTTDKWGAAYFWVKVPPFLRPDDLLEVRFYNLNSSPIYLDDLSVELWRNK